MLLEGRSILSGRGRQATGGSFLVIFVDKFIGLNFFEVQDFYGRFFWISHVFTRLPDFFLIFRIFLHIFKARSNKKHAKNVKFFLQVVEKRNIQGQISR